MTPEKVKFGQQVVNKFIEMILARMIDAELCQVRVRANLKQLARGELDGLTIEMYGFRLRQHLRVTEFRFDIGEAAVNIQSIMRRQIELLHPSEGTLLLVVTQEQLTSVLNSLNVSPSDEHLEPKKRQVNCQLGEDGAMVFHFEWIYAGEIASGSCTVIPLLKADGSGVVLNQGNRSGKEPPDEFVRAVSTQVSDILSLSDIANLGTTFHFEKIDITAGKITVRATTHIEHFPKV